MTAQDWIGVVGFGVCVACLCAFPFLVARQVERELARGRRIRERLAERREMSPWGEVVQVPHDGRSF